MDAIFAPQISCPLSSVLVEKDWQRFLAACAKHTIPHHPAAEQAKNVIIRFAFAQSKLPGRYTGSIALAQELMDVVGLVGASLSALARDNTEKKLLEISRHLIAFYCFFDSFCFRNEIIICAEIAVRLIPGLRTGASPAALEAEHRKVCEVWLAISTRALGYRNRFDVEFSKSAIRQHLLSRLDRHHVLTSLSSQAKSDDVRWAGNLVHDCVLESLGLWFDDVDLTAFACLLAEDFSARLVKMWRRALGKAPGSALSGVQGQVSDGYRLAAASEVVVVSREQLVIRLRKDIATTPNALNRVHYSIVHLVGAYPVCRGVRF